MMSLHFRSFLRMMRNAWEIYGLQIVTLSIALVAAILIISFAFNEFTVSHHFGDKSLVRILQRNDSPSYEGRNRLKDRVAPDVFDAWPRDVFVKSKTLNEINIHSLQGAAPVCRVHAVGENFFRILDFEGADFQHTAVDSTSAFLSASMARMLFPDSPAKGQSIRLSSGTDTVAYVVTGVFVDPPPNSHDDFKVLIGFSNTAIRRLGFDANQFGAYARLNPLREGFRLKAEVSDPFISYIAQPVRDIYFGPRVVGESSRHGDFYCVLILTCITGLIVVLAVTNFVNLSSLTLPTRSKELAIRKVAGAGRPTLLGLMAKESAFVVLLSLILAVVMIATIAAPAKDLIGIDLASWIATNTVSSWTLIVVLIASIALTPLLPAWTFVKASPGRLLGTEVITFPLMKKVITVVQLGVSISLIVTSLVINRQISRSLIKEPGKNYDQVVYMPFPAKMSPDYFLRLKTSWPRDNPNIVGLTAASHTPDNILSRIEGTDHHRLVVEPGFKEFFDIEMSSGRWFGPNDNDSCIVNKAANDHRVRPIGIVNNFREVYNLPDKPVRITTANTEFNFLMIRIIEVDIRKTIAYIERMFFESYGQPVSLTLMDRNYAATLAYEDRLDRVSGVLSIVALIMATCSIYALSLSRMNDNLKQIAIRKSFGASNIDIVRQLSVRFLELMVGSVFFFGPVTYFLLQEWLRNFVYAARFQWSDPLVSIGLCLLIVGMMNLMLLRRLSTSALRELLRR